jgi:hypothetical protein
MMYEVKVVVVRRGKQPRELPGRIDKIGLVAREEHSDDQFDLQLRIFHACAEMAT